MRELRLAIRHVLRAPGYAAAAILTLALAIGATTAILGVLDVVLLRPLPIRAPEDLVICWETDPLRNKGVIELSHRSVRELAASPMFERAAAVGSSNWPGVLTGRGEPTRVWMSGVSGAFFDTLGAVPLLGRAIREADDVSNAPRVVVVAYGTWVRRFGADPAVIGTTIRLEGELHTIVGVMPDAFDFPRGAEFWTPVVPILAAASEQWRANAFEDVGVLFLVARLREGMPAGAASVELNELADRLQRGSKPAPRFGSRLVVTPWLAYVLGPLQPALWLLTAAVVILLLIACANVSALTLTRVAVRRREHAIRVALGASRASLARLWMVETAILCTLGGAVGLLASYWIAAGVLVLAPDDVPRLAQLTIDTRVAMFGLAVVMAAALLCAAGPARQASSPDLPGILAAGLHATAGRRSLRGRSTLVVLQIALAVVLLVAAGLVVRSFHAMGRIDLGFDPINVLTLSVKPGASTPSPNDWYREAIDRIEGLPDVEAAGAVYLRPLALGPIGQGTWVVLEGQPDTPRAAAQNPVLNYQIATPGYFEAMRIARRRGRGFTAADAGNAPRVAIVGDSTARRLWPGEDPIGRRLRLPTFAKDGQSAWRTVVGVVDDVRYRGIDEVQLDVYDPAMQAALPAGDLVVRTSGPPLAMAAAVQSQIRHLDGRAVIDGITTMEAVVDRARAPWRLAAWLFAVFASLAFGLAAVGLAGLVGLDVAGRQRELALRIALGARRGEIVRSVLTTGGWRALAGVALGLGVALPSMRAVRSLLFGVEVVDAATYVIVVALVCATVAIASYLPARRAGDIDPVALLRRE